MWSGAVLDFGQPGFECMAIIDLDNINEENNQTQFLILVRSTVDTTNFAGERIWNISSGNNFFQKTC